MGGKMSGLWPVEHDERADCSPGIILKPPTGFYGQ